MIDLDAGTMFEALCAGISVTPQGSAQRFEDAARMAGRLAGKIDSRMARRRLRDAAHEIGIEPMLIETIIDREYQRGEKETEERANGHGSNRNYGPNGSNGQHNKRRARPLKPFVTGPQFLQEMKPPDYVTDGLILAGATYTLTGSSGHGKTLLALLLAIRMTRGEWFCGRKCRKGTVLFFAGENAENVRVQFYAMCADLEIEPPENLVFHAGVCSIDENAAEIKAAIASYPNATGCMFDSLQAFFEGEDDNSNVAMLNLAVAIRELTAAHPGRPTSLILAHPVKNAGRDNLLPRGGSAILNELDGNFTVWADGKLVELSWHGKLRGIPFEPIKLELVAIKPEGLKDARGDQMPCTVIRPLGDQREAELRSDEERRSLKLLAALDAEPGISQARLAILCGCAQSTVSRDLKGLLANKLIERIGAQYELTTKGKKRLARARERGEIA
jgi:hypothetical protein